MEVEFNIFHTVVGHLTSTYSYLAEVRGNAQAGTITTHVQVSTGGSIVNSAF